ncbi:MAG: glycosyltransferase family 2 protein [Ferruginibacter sp.]
MSPLSISVIIPVYKDRKNLQICLKGLKQASDACNYTTEVFVIDDCSPNGMEIKDDVESYGFFYRALPRNSGPAYARNFGASLAKGDIYFFIDSDVLVSPGTIKQVGDFFSESGHSYFAVIGSYDKECNSYDFPSCFKNLMHHYTHQNSKYEAPHFWTGCGAVYAAEFHKLNGFDTRYKGALVEDVEFGYRLRCLGKKIFLQKNLLVKHLKVYTFWNLFRSDFFNRALPMSQLMLKYKNMPNDQDTPHSAMLSAFLVFCSLLALILLAIFNNITYLISFLIFCLLIFAVNNRFVLFASREKGVLFGFQTFLFLNFYYLYCSIAFIFTYFNLVPSKLYRYEN